MLSLTAGDDLATSRSVDVRFGPGHWVPVWVPCAVGLRRPARGRRDDRAVLGDLEVDADPPRRGPLTGETRRDVLAGEDREADPARIRRPRERREGLGGDAQGEVRAAWLAKQRLGDQVVDLRDLAPPSAPPDDGRRGVMMIPRKLVNRLTRG